mgnify:FL=1
MDTFLLNICVFLDPTRKDKCSEFIFETINITQFIVNSNLFLFIALIFLLILIKIFFLNKYDNYSSLLLQFFLFSLFVLILVNFKTNIPWVDDWEWIENLQVQKISTVEWLLQPTNIHNIFFIKIIFLINNNFFNLNFELFNYLSIILIFLISIIFVKNEKIDNSIYAALFIILIFSGKQFANFSQASNIAWTICFFYIISFNYTVSSNKLSSIIFCSILIFISPLTFGLGYVLPLYVLIFIYFQEINYKIKINYVILSITGILLAQMLPRIFFDDLGISGSNKNYLNILFHYSFYLTFFGVLSNVFLPWIEGVAYIGTIIGFIQFLLISYLILKNYNQQSFFGIHIFIKNNTLIILGLIFAFIVSLTRPDLQTIVAARYSVGSIIFQIGFWLYLYKENQYRYLINVNFIKLVIIYILTSGLFFPYHGIHWQAKRHLSNNKVLECYKNDTKTVTNRCNKLAYNTLFYGGKWYEIELFNEQIKILKDKNKSFLNF